MSTPAPIRPGPPAGPAPPWNVLVLPAGTEIGLEVHRALSQNRLVRLHGAGQDMSNHAPFVFERYDLLPSVYDPAYLGALNGLIARRRIHFVIPAYDDVIVALARDADRIDARVVTSPLETCLVARSKSQTYARLAGAVPVPDRHEDPDAIAAFPVFAKPDRGQGSQRTHRVADAGAIRALRLQDDDYIFLEYLPGPEYTIDCFSHRHQGLLYCEGRRRIRTRNGISVSSGFAPERREEFRSYAEAIASRLEFHGAWFFQLKEDACGALKLLEVAPRIAGTMALSRVRGVNFPLLSLYENLGLPVRILLNDADITIDRALTNRYRSSHVPPFRSVYVDLDDTLIVRGKVNTQLVRLLYQCINDGIRVVLVTRHREDLRQTLDRHRLAGIFDDVVHLTEPGAKSRLIHEADAIFIDDSFRERQEVHDELGIRTYDSSMIEALIDDRD